MAVQYTTYNTDGATRTFPSTKHIATIQHVGVYRKRVIDNVWVIVNISEYNLVQNAIIFDIAPDIALYSQIEIRVADDSTEITTAPSDIATVAGSIASVNIVATNIASVNTVATNIGSVNNTSANIANVNAVGGSILNVSSVAADLANINAVALDLTNIDSVALDLANINIVALAKPQVDTVASWVGLGFPIVATSAVVVGTVADLGTIDNILHTTAIVKDLNRGGTFIWSSTGVANGGTVFAGTTGYWNRQYSGAINIKWFGAKGDGIADDSLAIQNAINVGGIIFSPIGIYALNSDIEINSTTTQVSLIGSGIQEVYGPGASGSVWKRIGTGNVIRCGVLADGTGTKTFPRLSISGMIFEGDGTSVQTGVLMYWTRMTMRDCSFFNLYNGVNYPTTPADEYSDLGLYQNIRFGGIRGSYGMRLKGADSTTIDQVKFEGNSCNTNLEISFAHGAKLSNILSNNNKVFGLTIRYSQGIVVEGFHAEGCLQNNASYVYILDSSSIEISGCFISHNQVASITGCKAIQIAREANAPHNITFKNSVVIDGNGSITDYSIVGDALDIIRGVQLNQNKFLASDGATIRTANRVSSNANYSGFTSQGTDNTGGFTVFDTSNVRTAYVQNGSIYSSGNYLLGAGVTWSSGVGSPEGVVTAIIGSLYSRTDGGTTTSLYVKTSGTGNTGWTSK